MIKDINDWNVAIITENMTNRYDYCNDDYYYYYYYVW